LYDDFGDEEEDEECAYAPGSPSGRQGSDLMNAKRGMLKTSGTIGGDSNALGRPLTGMVPLGDEPHLHAELQNTLRRSSH